MHIYVYACINKKFLFNKKFQKNRRKWDFLTDCDFSIWSTLFNGKIKAEIEKIANSFQSDEEN